MCMLCFPIVYVLPSFPKADAKVRDIIVTTKYFRKFFLKKFFFETSIKGGTSILPTSYPFSLP